MQSNQSSLPSVQDVGHRTKVPAERKAQLKFEGADIAGGEGAGGGRDEGVRSVLGVGRRVYATDKGPQ